MSASDEKAAVAELARVSLSGVDGVHSVEPKIRVSAHKIASAAYASLPDLAVQLTLLFATCCAYPNWD
jgi:hypothetical protein